jgi:hypothetical protein
MGPRKGRDRKNLGRCDIPKPKEENIYRNRLLGNVESCGKIKGYYEDKE